MDAGDLRDLFATNLRRLRHQRGLSQDELADGAGMSRSYLAQIETGRFHVSLRIIGKLAVALEAEPAEFLIRKPGPEDRAKTS
jgi:transcriptional regulator with XRE-family HTH domain